jgi:hypothetical protein
MPEPITVEYSEPPMLELHGLQQTTFQTNEKVTSIDFSDLTHGIAVTTFIHVYRTNKWYYTGQDLLMANQTFISAAYCTYREVLVLGDSYGGLSILHQNSGNYLYQFKSSNQVFSNF